MNVDIATIIRESADVITRYAFDFIGAILILIGGWIVAGWVRRACLRAFNRSKRIDDTVAPFLAAAVRYGVLVIIVVMVLAQFGVQTASIIAALGAAGLAIGLALQGTLSNIAAGLMLLVLRPFNVGDSINAGSVEGAVESIGLFATELRSADGIYLFVPNSEIWNKAIRNFSRNGTRRLDIAVGVAYEDDVEEALEVLRNLVKAEPRLLNEPGPQVTVKNLGESSVDLNVRGWAARSDYWSVVWDLNKNIKKALDAAGISIPYPQRDLRIVDGPKALVKPS